LIPEKLELNKVDEYLDESVRLMRLSLNDSARFFLRKTDSLARYYNDDDALASVYGNLGLINIREGDFEIGAYYTNLAIALDEEMADTSSLVLHVSQKARIFRDKAQYSEAVGVYERALDLAILSKDSLRIGTVSNGLGNVLIELEDYSRALDYYAMAVLGWGSANRMANVAIAIHNQGDALRGLGRLDEALATYKKALKLKRELNRTSSSAYTLTGLGRTYILLDSIQKAEEVLQEALEIRSKSSNKTSYAESLLIMSRVSLAKKQYQKAEAQLKEVEQIARDYNKADLLRDAFEDQRALYKAWGKLAQLAAVDEVYDIMTDSLYREEKLKVQEAQSAASLQREQQKTQIAEQNARLTSLELASASQKAQFRLILVVIALMGVLVIAWQLMQIRKRNATLIALNARIKLITDNAFHSQKNALGLISALLRSKARQSQHEKELEVLRDVESKIEALGGVAKSLFQRRIEDNTAVAARVQLKPYLEELVEDTFSSVSRDADLDLSVDDIEVTSTEALNIGLIANEAITNFSKYAESAGADTLLIRVSREGEQLQLSFTDNGPGFPPGFDFGSSSGFGMQMMANLVEDMEGTIEISREEGLTVITVQIPLKG
jgi:two-component sensor histidine kinase